MDELLDVLIESGGKTAFALPILGSGTDSGGELLVPMSDAHCNLDQNAV